MSETINDQRRYERYYRVVTAAAASAEFSVADVKAACAEEPPAYVTRVITDLRKGDWVQPLDEKFNQFRWAARRDDAAAVPRAGA